MCGLFGLIDYKGILAPQKKEKIIRELSIASEVRGTHATGIAYTYNNDVIINKAAQPAHNMYFRLRSNPAAVIGHCRFTTQGSEKKNDNNHPFYSEKLNCAFAHNGVLYNDQALRISENLPETIIETDSYVALQLIEKQNEITFDTLKNMSEKVKGTFNFTLLDGNNNVYIIKGNNPFVLVDCGYYIYASTEKILATAMHKLGIFKSKNIKVDDNEILKIDAAGKIEKAKFEMYKKQRPAYDDKYYDWVNEYYGLNDYKYKTRSWVL